MIALLHYSFDICRLVSKSDHDHEDPLESILNGNNEATEDSASTDPPDLSPGLIDTVTTNKLFNFFKISYSLSGILLTIQAIQLPVVEAVSQIIIVMEQTLLKTKVGTSHKINVLKNYKNVVQKGSPIDQRLANVFQDLA